MYLKDNDSWKPISKVYVKDSGSWQQVFGITSLFAAFSSVGTTNFTVPAGVYSIFVSYPTTTGVVTTSVVVTPAQVIPITIGDYGATSSFNGQTLPAYSKVVLNHFSGNVDLNLGQSFSVGTTTSIAYTTNGTNNAASFAAFAAVGIYFETTNEVAQGDFGESVTIDTVPKSTLLGNYQITAFVTGSGGFLNGAITQPSAANNYICSYNIGEGNRSNNPVQWTMTLQQQGYVSISYTNVSYATPGTASTFTVPTGVYQLAVTVAGGGGSGGAAYQSGGTTAGGNNGTGGQIVTGILQVQPGQTFTIQPGSGAGVARGSWVGGTGGAAGTGYSATYNGAAGTTNGNGGGGGSGGSSVILSSTGSAIIVAGGGAGGQGAVSLSGGAGGSAGSSTLPAGFTSSTATNGGAGATPVASYSGSYSNGTGPSQLSVIQSDIVNTYPFLYTPGGSISGVVGGGNDWNFPMTLGNGVNLLARGSVLNYDNASGAFSVGRTVSGINFTYGATQANGGQSFNFYTGMIPAAGSAGYVSITY